MINLIEINCICWEKTPIICNQSLMLSPYTVRLADKSSVVVGAGGITLPASAPYTAPQVRVPRETGQVTSRLNSPFQVITA